MLKVAAAQRKAAIAKERERLVVPGRPGRRREARRALREQGARRGEGPEGRQRDRLRRGRVEERCRLAEERRRDDLVHHDRPTLTGFEFVVADKDGTRRLITRDAQHEYVFERPRPRRSPDRTARERSPRRQLRAFASAPLTFGSTSFL